MSAFPQLAWLESFRDRVNADPEMKLIGRWFTTPISLSFGEIRYVLHIAFPSRTRPIKSARIVIYQGDVHFYSNDWDAREDLGRIDTRRCRVALLAGEYDYSCTPAMTEAVAKEIPGARFTVMSGMGHFPMVENYPEFRRYLLPELELMLAPK